MPSGLSCRRRIAVIGYGAITREIVSCLESLNSLDSLAGVLVRPDKIAQARNMAASRFPVVASLEALLSLSPGIVIEAAGHSAVASFAGKLLESGTDVMVASAGALAGADLERQLDMAAKKSGANIFIPSGAAAGLDGLLAARTAGLRSVAYTSLKAPEAWLGTPAETLLRGAPAGKRTLFFEGTAREAARLYPKNVNVAAAISFAGIGLDRTRVTIGADPSLAGPLGIIDAEGDFGRFHFEILALASPANPKTSFITGHSIAVAALHGTNCFPLF